MFRNSSPGHLEFWFFGWSPRHYRRSFILQPLPAFIIIPYVIHCINLIKSKLRTPYPIIADVRPEFETMIIKQRKKQKFTEIFPFISQEQMDTLRYIANQVAIDSSFEDEYIKHINDAFEKAIEYYKLYDYRKSRIGSYKRNRRMRKRNLTIHQQPNF